MTLDLTPIKARVAATTPGPWQVWDGPEYVGGGADLCIGAGEKWLVNMDHRSCLTLQQLVDEGPSHAPPDDCPICSLGEADITGEQRANAEFIANARVDVVALVAEVERLRSRLPASSARFVVPPGDYSTPFVWPEGATPPGSAMDAMNNVVEEDDGA